MSDVIMALQVTHTRRSPVFVVGYARSGTSLTCRLLRRYLKVSFGTESQFIIRYHRRLAAYGDLECDANMQQLILDISRERFFTRSAANWGFVFAPYAAFTTLESRSYRAVLDAIFGQLAAHNGMVRWGDKTPQYINHLPTLLELYPDAQFVHVLRDGRDVALSLRHTTFGPKNACETALAWTRAVTRVRTFADTLPPRQFVEVRYEELIDRPADVLMRLADFLGIDDTDGKLSAYISTCVRGEVRSDNSGKWRTTMRAREVERFEALAGRVLRADGYELAFSRRARRVSAAERLWWRSHGAVARLLMAGWWNDVRYKAALRTRGFAAHVRRPRRQVAAANGAR